MRHLKTTLAVLGAVTILLLAGNTIALAATGQALLLGKSNSANNITAVTRTTSGSALKLQTQSSTNPPLTVNGKGKVTNLNADTVDGLDSAALKNRAYVFTRAVTVGATTQQVIIPLAAGKYVLSYSAYMNGATSTTVGCYLARTNPTQYVGESRFTSGTQTPGVTGSGFLDVSATSVVTLNCSAGSAWTTFTDEPIQVVATKVDTASTATARVAAPRTRVQ